MPKPIVFISHINEEAELAKELKELIEGQYVDAVEVFASSHEQSITFGTDWFETIKKSIHNADVMIVLCSPLSVSRTWIPFEAGAGWHRGIPVIPLCHSGLKPSSLPAPLNSLQGGKLGLEGDIRKTFNVISNVLNSRVPSIGDTKLFEIVRKFENKVLESSYAKHLEFVSLNLDTTVQQLDSYIFSAFGKKRSESLNVPFDGNDFRLPKMLFLFKPSLLFSDAAKIKIYDALYRALVRLVDDIKFVLTYRGDKLPPNLVLNLEQPILFLQELTVPMAFMSVMSEAEGVELQSFLANYDDTKSEVVCMNDIIYPFVIYYNALEKISNWIVDFDKLTKIS